MENELTADEAEAALQKLAQDFLTELSELCRVYGFELDTCLECPSVTLVVSEGLLDRYVLDGNHIMAKYIEVAKAA